MEFFDFSNLYLGLIWKSDWNSAARAVDSHYRFKDRTVTALQFVDRAQDATLHQLQIADALRHLTSLRAKEVVPMRAPRILLMQRLARCHSYSRKSRQRVVVPIKSL